MYIYIHTHTDIHTYIDTWLARISKTVTDCFTANSKLSELFLDARDHRGSDFGQVRISTEMVTFSQEHCMKGKYTFFIKLNCSVTNVDNGFTYKEFKRNYMKFQKAAILLWNEGMSKT
jgi:hypothetical protein